MNVFDRIFALHRRLNAARRPISKAALENELECSSATVKRIIHDMRLYLDASIEYDRRRRFPFNCREQLLPSTFETPGVDRILAG